MRKRTVAILLIVAVVLLPTWFAALQGGEHVEEVGIDTSQTTIRPLQSVVHTPTALTPAQVGIIIWVALGLLLAVLVAVHRFVDHLARPSGTTATPDGGAVEWFETDHRWIAEYVPATESTEGLTVIVALSALVVVLAVLVVTEFTTLARTQYFGFYVGGIFLALAGLTAAYYAWFVPQVTVAEERYHE